MFSKPNALVYVHRSGIIVYGKHVIQARLQFPADAVSRLEVLNSRAFAQLCAEFFIEKHLKHARVLMILDYSIVFEKSIGFDESGKPDMLAEAFISAVPLEPEQRLVRTVSSKDQLQIFATNGDLVTYITEALTAASVAKVTSIVPVAAFHLDSTKQPVSKLAELFFSDSTTRKSADFLAD